MSRPRARGSSEPSAARRPSPLGRSSTPLAFGPFFDPVGDLMTQLVDVHPRAVIQQINELRCGANGANLELFQYTAPGQNRRTPLNSDWAGNHFAVYVTDIAAATSAMRGRARP